MKIQGKTKRLGRNGAVCNRANRWLTRFKTAYLTDTFTLYNETNKLMQGPKSNIMQCKAAGHPHSGTEKELPAVLQSGKIH